MFSWKSEQDGLLEKSNETDPNSINILLVPITHKYFAGHQG